MSSVKIRKVVVTGPESTAKTSISIYLARELNAILVPEYAREYIENLNRPYEFEDLERIALRQVELENESMRKAGSLIIFDTYLIITKVWFQEVYKSCPVWIDNRLKESGVDLFLLCDTDIPWVPDRLRENPGAKRRKLFYRYQQEIESLGGKYRIIRGEGQARLDQAMIEVSRIID